MQRRKRKRLECFVCLFPPCPGNYPQALEDFQECLCLQLKYLPLHNRLLAETHYHVATTLCYMDKYSQAIQHYNSSIEVIEKRLGEELRVADVVFLGL